MKQPVLCPLHPLFIPTGEWKVGKDDWCSDSFKDVPVGAGMGDQWSLKSTLPMDGMRKSCQVSIHLSLKFHTLFLFLLISRILIIILYC